MIAAIFALAAFVVAILGGLAAGNPSARILTVALVSLILCYIVGSVAGAIGEWVISEHVKARTKGAAPATAKAETVPGAKSAPT
jgi:hypothetical protein